MLSNTLNTQILNPVEKLHPQYTLGKTQSVYNCFIFIKQFIYLYQVFAGTLSISETETNLSLFFCFYYCIRQNHIARDLAVEAVLHILMLVRTGCHNSIVSHQSCCIISWSCRHWKMSQHSENSWHLQPLRPTKKVFDACWTRRFLTCRSLAIQNPCLEYSTNSLRIQPALVLIHF